jgi:hypothetical protein
VLLARITVRDGPWPYDLHPSHYHRFRHHPRPGLLRVPFDDMTHALCPARGPALPSLSVNSLNIKSVLPTPSPTDLPPGALAADAVPQLEPSQDRRRWYPPQSERPTTLMGTSRRYSGVVQKWHTIRGRFPVNRHQVWYITASGNPTILGTQCVTTLVQL